MAETLWWFGGALRLSDRLRKGHAQKSRNRSLENSRLYRVNRCAAFNLNESRRVYLLENSDLFRQKHGGR
jgi:hypothetical protein